MALLTRAQWDAKMAKLPKEDRSSYDEYVAAQQKKETPAPAPNVTIDPVKPAPIPAPPAAPPVPTATKEEIDAKEAKRVYEANLAAAKAKEAADEAAYNAKIAEAAIAKAKTEADAKAAIEKAARLQAEADALAAAQKAERQKADDALAAQKATDAANKAIADAKTLKETQDALAALEKTRIDNEKIFQDNQKAVDTARAGTTTEAITKAADLIINPPAPPPPPPVVEPTATVDPVIVPTIEVPTPTDVVVTPPPVDDVANNNDRIEWTHQMQFLPKEDQISFEEWVAAKGKTSINLGENGTQQNGPVYTSPDVVIPETNADGTFDTEAEAAAADKAADEAAYKAAADKAAADKAAADAANATGDTGGTDDTGATGNKDRVEWSRQMQLLPAEDRISFEEWTKAKGGTGGTGSTGDTGGTEDTGGVTRPPGTPKAYVYNETTKTWERPPQPEDDRANTYTWNDNDGWVKTPVTGVKTVTGSRYEGTGKDRKKITTYSDGTETTEDAPEDVVPPPPPPGGGDNNPPPPPPPGGGGDNPPPPPGGTGGTGGTGGFTQDDIDKAVQDALDKAKNNADKESMINILNDRFTKYGLQSLIPQIKKLAVDGASSDTITFALQETEEYKTRFKANADRIKNNLAVLAPGDYLNVEDGYRQVLRSFGLKQFDTDEFVSQFISNDTSVPELTNRVIAAVQRVQNADPAISKQLRDYYGIGQADLIAYTLSPATEFEKIKRQIGAAEIGVAAGVQGLNAGVGVAEQLYSQGITQAEAQKGYATIADILPTAEKLSSIYGGTMDTYGQAEGEQEVFNSLASAQRTRQKLSAREVAQFGGSSGASRNAFSTGGKQSNSGLF